MIDRLDQLYREDKSKLYKDIWDHQKKHTTTLINFLYFANIVKNKLPKRKKTMPQKTYYHNITKSDFLLPDGIALQAFYKVASILGYSSNTALPNHNGTDFVPYFLQKSQKDKKKMHIHLYGASPETINKAKQYFEQYASIGYTHHGYEDLDDKELQQLIENFSPTHTNILLIARGTPIQENRANKYQNFLSNTIIFTVGWLFDFMTGTETRAPQRMRGRGERLYRLITKPSKNASKVRYTLGWIPYTFRYLLLKRLTDSIRSR
jgi:exopolysaccharide biosynthesis WecB/TagA/CpsF family protein